MVCARQAPLSTQLHCQPLRHSNPLIFLICGCLNALISIGPIEPEDIIGIKSEHCYVFLPSSNTGAGTYTTSSLSTKSTTTSDPPNICKVKPQQLQTSSLPSASHFSQLSCMPSLIAQQQQSPQVYVSQSAAGNNFRFGYRNLENEHLCFSLLITL